MSRSVRCRRLSARRLPATIQLHAATTTGRAPFPDRYRRATHLLEFRRAWGFRLPVFSRPSFGFVGSFFLAPFWLGRPDLLAKLQVGSVAAAAQSYLEPGSRILTQDLLALDAVGA